MTRHDDERHQGDTAPRERTEDEAAHPPRPIGEHDRPGGADESAAFVPFGVPVRSAGFSFFPTADGPVPSAPPRREDESTTATPGVSTQDVPPPDQPGPGDHTAVIGRVPGADQRQDVEREADPAKTNGTDPEREATPPARPPQRPVPDRSPPAEPSTGGRFGDARPDSDGRESPGTSTAEPTARVSVSPTIHGPARPAPTGPRPSPRSRPDPRDGARPASTVGGPITPIAPPTPAPGPPPGRTIPARAPTDPPTRVTNPSPEAARDHDAAETRVIPAVARTPVDPVRRPADRGADRPRPSSRPRQDVQRPSADDSWKPTPLNMSAPPPPRSTGPAPQSTNDPTAPWSPTPISLPDDEAPAESAETNRWWQEETAPSATVEEKGGGTQVALLSVIALIVCVVLAVGVVVAMRSTNRSSATPPGEQSTSVGQLNTPANAAPPGVAQADKLEANPILRPGLTLPAVTCELPRIGRATQQLKNFYVAAVDCLTKTWGAALAPTGIDLRAPGVEVEAVSSNACGVVPAKDEAVAFYCGAVIYMPRDRLLADAGLSEAIHLQVLAHEFGHHVQDQAKILIGADRRGAGLEANDPDQLLLSRRVELQANCFSGMFLASAVAGGTIKTATANAAVRSFSEFLSSKTHGTSKNQGKWGKSGFTANNTNVCNTWIAKPTEVE